ncbi:MAG: prolyl oligopeptidase family serine peptidase [Planctomycetota bacterium]
MAHTHPSCQFHHRAVSALLILMLLPLATVAAQEKAGDTGKIDIPGHRSYYVGYVADTAVGKETPLLVCLHYSGGTAEQFLNQWKGSVKAAGWKAISVFSTAGPGGWDPGDGPMVLAAVDHFCKEHRVDRDRVFLTGHSAGAHATVMFATWHPNVFAAAAASAGGMFDRNKATADSKKTAFFFLIGDKDPNWQSVSRYVPMMKEAGYRVRCDLIPGLGHAYPPDGHQRIMAFFNDHGQVSIARKALDVVSPALKDNQFGDARERLARAREAVKAELTDELAKADMAALAPKVEALQAEYETRWTAWLEANPDEAKAMKEYDDALADFAKGRDDKAAGALEKLIEKSGESQAAGMARVKLQQWLTDPQTGAALADKLAGNGPKSLFEKGERYRKRDRMDDAKKCFDEVIEKWPHTSWAAKAREASAAGSDDGKK